MGTTITHAVVRMRGDINLNRDPLADLKRNLFLLEETIATLKDTIRQMELLEEQGMIDNDLEPREEPNNQKGDNQETN